MGTRCANHVTPLYPQKLALTSPTGGGRSVGMVRSRTKATEYSLGVYISHTFVKFDPSVRERNRHYLKNVTNETAFLT